MATEWEEAPQVTTQITTEILPRTGDDPTAAVWEIVERAQAGDRQAFGALYERYSDLVFRYCYFRLGHRQRAEDAAADTWTRALRSIGSLRWQGRDPAAWLVTIARNLIADHYKSSRYRLELLTGEPIGPNVPTGDTGPELAAIAADVNDTLRAALNILSPEQRAVVELRFLAGLDVAETARAVGNTTGAVKALQFRALRALARHLPGFISTERQQHV